MEFSRTERRVFEAVREVVVRRTFDRASAAGEMCEQLFALQGPLSRQDDELLIGDIIINRDRTLLTSLARATGLGISVYLGSTRIAGATVPDAGTAPPLRAPAPRALIDSVLRRGDTFKGSIEYDNRPYLVVARPLKNPDDPKMTAMGMIEVFQDEQIFSDLLAATARGGLQDQTSDLIARSDTIDSIMTFVDDVARRLQLLALNGNIIASQAAEHGRAFRVVCRELGSLASQVKITGSELRKLVMAIGPDDYEGDDDPAWENSPIEQSELGLYADGEVEVPNELPDWTQRRS